MLAAGAAVAYRHEFALSVAYAASTAMFAIEVWGGFAFNSSSLHASAADFVADAAIYATSLFGMGISARPRLRAALFTSAISVLAGIAALASSLYHLAAVATPHGHAMALIGFVAFLINSAVTVGLGRIRSGSSTINYSHASERLGPLAAIAAGAAICATGSRWPDLAAGWIVGVLLSRPGGRDCVKSAANFAPFWSRAPALRFRPPRLRRMRLPAIGYFQAH